MTRVEVGLGRLDRPELGDRRAVFSEVAVRHLGVPETALLFPGWSGARLPLARAS